MSEKLISTPAALVTLAAAPSVQVTAPNGGESVPAGSRTTVTWNAGGDLASQRVQYTLDGVTFTPIATGLAPAVRSVPWDVPATLIPAGQGSVQARIRVIVTDVAGAQASDVSDAPFTIRAPQPAVTVQVTAPGANATLDAGATVAIQWTSTGATNHRVQFINRATGAVTPIATGLDGGARGFSWTVPLDLLPAGQQATGVCRVIARNVDTGAEAMADSPGVLTLRGPQPVTVQVTAPAVNTTLDVGATLPIQWNSTGATNHRVQFINRPTGVVTPIATGLDGNARSFGWTIPTDFVPPGQTVEGTITVIARSTVTGQEASSQGAGIVTLRGIKPLSVTVTKPAADVTVIVGGSLPIEWTGGGASSQRVQFVDAGGAVTPIATGLDGAARTFTWTVPPDFAAPGQQRAGRIRVVAVDAGGQQRSSDSPGLVTVRGVFVQVSAPAANVTLDVGGTLDIRWTSGGATSHRVQFAESTGTVTPIAAGLGGGATSYAWTIPQDFVAPGQQRIGRIRVVAGIEGTGLQAADDSDGTVTVTPGAPAITSLTPAQGYLEQSVTLVGRKLTGATAVRFGDTVAGFRVLDETRIAAGVPVLRTQAQGALQVPVTVTTPRGTGTSPSPFTVLPFPVPAIDRIDPPSAAEGARIAILGRNLLAVGSPVTTVAFAARGGGTLQGLAPVFLETGGRIEVTVPQGAASGPLTVTTPGGSAQASFTVTTPTTGVQFAPLSGPAGIDVAISGPGTAGATAVLFNGVPSPDLARDEDGTLLAEVPEGATSGTVTVVTPGGTLASTAAFTVTALVARPGIQSFSPLSVMAGMDVTVNGNGFVAGMTRVLFTGTGGTVVRVRARVDTNRLLRVTVPASAVTGPLIVKTPDGKSRPSDLPLVIGAPTITSFTPTRGRPGTAVEISGTNFVTGQTAVRFGGVDAALPPTVLSPMRVRAFVPAGAVDGPITVQTPQGSVDSAASFDVDPFPPPVLAGIAPASGMEGTPVTLSGTGLVDEPVIPSTVAFSGPFGPVAAPFAQFLESSIVTEVPAGAASGPVTVTTAGGQASIGFTVTVPPAPVITGFAPQGGGAGTRVTISGDNFVGLVSGDDRIRRGVFFAGAGGTEASALVLPASTRTMAVVEVPANAVTGPIRVVAQGGEAVSAASFTVGGSGAGLQLSPASGPAGIDVVIGGAALAGATAVLFGGLASPDFEVNADGTLLAEVPEGAASGVVSVVTPGGTLTSGGAFTVTAADPPSVAGFTPASAREGTEVAIAGQGFVPGATTVVFRGRERRVRVTGIVDSSASLRVIVPATAVTGPLIVKTPKGKSAPSARELVIGGPSVADFAPRSGGPGDVVSISGENFVPGETTARFNGVPAVTTVVSLRALQAVVPDGATSGPLTVQTPQGTATAEALFTVAGASVALSATPASRTVAPGQPAVYTVALARTGFAGAVDLAVSGLPTGSAAVFSPDPATGTTSTLTITVPAGTPPGVRTPVISGTAPGAAVAPTTVELAVTLHPPAITGFTPASGAPGTAVTVTGADLVNVSAVRFGAVDAAQFTSFSATQLRAVVPQGAVSAPISVVTPGGTAQSPIPFTITPNAGVVLSASPAAATVAAGQTARFAINLARTSFAGAVDLAVSGLPAGTRAAFSADPATGLASVLTITTSTLTPAGRSKITVSGTAPGITIAPITLLLTVAGLVA